MPLPPDPRSPQDGLPFTWEHSVVDGIERVTCRPRVRRYDTPLLFSHGMWHGAWCWRGWQELFALWGWESVAFSLPGHGESPVQRPIRWCTLGYYTEFLKREIDRMHRKPVVVGHSLGTALCQRYMKDVGDLPASVMLAPWLSHSMIGLVGRYFGLDLPGALATVFTLTATPCIRNARNAARIFLSDTAVCSAEELHAGLCGESMLLPLQHNPPFWKPKTDVDTPLLWISAGKDLLIPEDQSRISAKEFNADYMVAELAGHDLMMEPDHALTAAWIHDWLAQRFQAEFAASEPLEADFAA
ncbi:MAG: alpha/beta hydrolase [Planctomycetota bacterium]